MAARGILSLMWRHSQFCQATSTLFTLILSPFLPFVKEWSVPDSCSPTSASKAKGRHWRSALSVTAFDLGKVLPFWRPNPTLLLQLSQGWTAMGSSWGCTVRFCAHLWEGDKSHHGHSVIWPGRAKFKFSLRPTTWVLSWPSGAVKYARFVFYAIATNTMHKGYYIFVHPF